ncbi:MAG: hypothetical protein AAF725_12670 [Acidobacteriota bacterium]
MTYLIGQIFLCLLIAAILGGILGWWLRGLGARREREDLLERVGDAEGQQAKASARLEEAEARLAELGGRESGAEELEELEDELKARSEEANRSEAALEECRTRRAELEEQARESAARIEALEADLQAARSKNSDLQKGLAAGAAVAAGASASAPPPDPDDLKVIEGVGPKIEGLLNVDGLYTWRSVADAETGRLQRILDEAGPRYRIHDPGTWRRQAALAADGKWEDLEEFQDFLKGGREPG